MERQRKQKKTAIFACTPQYLYNNSCACASNYLTIQPQSGRPPPPSQTPPASLEPHRNEQLRRRQLEG